MQSPAANLSELFALGSYLFVMAITPGPNNIMLATSGVNFGFRSSVPHMLGICFGNALQVLFCAGLYAIVSAWIGELRKSLAVVGCIYLVWLAFQLARATAPGRGAVLKPMSFFGATAFQCVNPKAWVMVLNTALLFMPREGKLPAAFGLAFAGAIVGLPCIAIWAWSGEKLRYWLQKKWALNAFNLCMAMLLAATALWLLMDELRRGSAD